VKILVLHDLNNPEKIVPFDMDDFSAAQPWNGGSWLKLKSSDAPLLVKESTEVILKLLERAQQE